MVHRCRTSVYTVKARTSRGEGKAKQSPLKKNTDVATLTPMLAKLPSYGGGDAYYRCPYCAYLKGFEDGRRETMSDSE